MNSKRLFYGFVGLYLLLVAGIISSVVFGTNHLTKQNASLSSLKAKASELELVQNSLSAAKNDIEQYSAIEQIAKSVVPQEKDQARTVREIINLADQSDIAISNVSFPTSTLGDVAPRQSGAAATQGGTTTQTQKVDGINGVERLEITVTSDSSKPVFYTDFVNFLESLEQNRRTSQVSSINIQPVNSGSQLTFSLVINVYIKK